MSTRHLYSPLDVEGFEIRLLEVLPDQFTSPIRTVLRHAKLQDGLVFSALSYTWGNPDDRISITVNGHIFQATSNLYNALQNLRHPEEVRTFWIDAICINQNDNRERDAQVLRMTEIYSKATSVEVFLGEEESEDDESALRLVSQLGSAANDPEIVLKRSLSEEDKSTCLEILAHHEPKVLLAMIRLFNRPWWTRIWIVQEVSLATQDMVTVRCGHHTTQWLYFLVTVYVIEALRDFIGGDIWTISPDENFDAWQNGVRLAQCRNVDPRLPGFTLLDLLHQHRDCAATNPRDKVYGLLGLAADVDSIGIQPSYDSTPAEVYKDLLQKHFRATQSLDMLCAVRFPRKLDQLPSWVPDWSTDQIVPGICINDRYVGGNDFEGSPIAHFCKYAASGKEAATASFEEDKLIVQSRYVGVVKHLGIIDSGLVTEDLDVIETFGQQDEEGYSGSASETFNEWFNMILKCTDWPKIAGRYGDENVWEVFCRTIIADAGIHTMVMATQNDEDTPDHQDADSESGRGSPSHIKEDLYHVEKTEEDGSDAQDESTTFDNVNEEQRGEASDIEQKGRNRDRDEKDHPVALESPADILAMSNESYRDNLEVCWGKRFAILDNGYMGIVPAGTLPEDQVVVVNGCSMPLVVRKEDRSYKLIGESYIHGVMDGEIMDIMDGVAMCLS